MKGVQHVPLFPDTPLVEIILNMFLYILMKLHVYHIVDWQFGIHKMTYNMNGSLKMCYRVVTVSGDNMMSEYMNRTIHLKNTRRS